MYEATTPSMEENKKRDEKPQVLNSGKDVKECSKKKEKNTVRPENTLQSKGRGRLRGMTSTMETLGRM